MSEEVYACTNLHVNQDCGPVHNDCDGGRYLQGYLAHVKQHSALGSP